jgi:hypothetical protein
MKIQRAAALVLAAISAQAAVAGRSTESISQMYSLFITSIVQSTGNVCSARFPSTAPQWKKSTEEWKKANSAAIDELETKAMAIQAQLVGDAFDPASKDSLESRAAQVMMFSGFGMLAASGPYQMIGTLNDAAATEACTKHLNELAAGGAMDDNLRSSIHDADHLFQGLKRSAR